MYTKLRKFKSRSIFFIFLLCFLFQYPSSIAQDCIQSLNFEFKPSLAGKGVNWFQFPEFTLPFKVVYGGASSFANSNFMFKRGFTHFSNPNDLTKLPIKNRAFIYYGVAFTNPNLQPWALLKSPWNNDMKVYQAHWDREIMRMKVETSGNTTIDTDILVFDIERQIKSEDSILVLKSLPSTSQDLKNLSNTGFIDQYKKQLQDLYFNSVDYTLKNGKINSPFISSYADTPILNTFTNIQGKSWQDWKINKGVINFLTFDFANNKVGGKFYDSQTILTPSAYFYFDYPHPFASEYLSYLLFQCEANRAWSNKDLLLYVWLKYSYTPEFVHKNIRPWMAEACGVFPFFAGAKGIWLWEQTGIVKNEDNLSNYEYFTKGLYRVSQFKEMFEGDYKLIEAFSAREYNENKLPIWRGIQNGKKILVAAQNPYAKSESEEVILVMNYGSWSKTIKLKGYEVFMCKYDFDLNLSVEPEINIVDFHVFPNPSSKTIGFKLILKNESFLTIRLSDMDGKELYKEKLTNKVKMIDRSIDLKANLSNQVILTIETATEKKSARVLIY